MSYVEVYPAAEVWDERPRQMVTLYGLQSGLEGASDRIRAEKAAESEEAEHSRRPTATRALRRNGLRSTTWTLYSGADSHSHRAFSPSRGVDLRCPHGLRLREISWQWL
eukprot:gnl/TRDRNA2_/TRDRNA2_31017_c0_seq1.p1 gnl/TRDRNA2_/TRDRNA2_31017_c0~~gnl/TRDRNA2_/TRDRNA2_31017_c0_seq1.p1  ORF type:complete len:109 (+),score=7.78 gnl/TRDRNA2_/TRDRNA2_31017_c0_seq1:100-426(+)